MKLVAQTAPYIRKNVSVKRMMLDVIIALMPVTIFSMIQNGWASIYVILISLITMVLCELLCHMFIKWPKGMKPKELFSKEGFNKIKATYTINNITAPVISALIYAMIMPAHCNPYVVFIGAFIGIFIGKMVFGGLGSNVFNPAAVGRIFVGICFGNSISNAYKAQDTYISANASGTPLGLIKTDAGLNLANTSGYSILDLFIGNVPGCMGEVCKICILIGAVYLFIRKSADLRAALGYFLTFAIIMFIACLSYSIKFDGNVGEMWLYQILSGGVLFGAVFMITDPVTSPTTKYGRVLYAAIAACITALIRVCGAYPEGVAFSILIVNALAPCIDYFMRGKPNTYTWKQCVVLGSVIVIVCCIISASVMGGWF
ncbi:MAG: RnfABCDGE type electron transport complex subunit D [Anaeroplasma sp.]